MAAAAADAAVNGDLYLFRYLRYVFDEELDGVSIVRDSTDCVYPTCSGKVSKPLAGYLAIVGDLSGTGRIRVVRLSSSSMHTRISILASGAPGQTWIPSP